MSSTQRRLPAILRVSMREEADRLEKLAADLRRIAEGEGPLPSDLIGAPILDRWEILQHPTPYLTGIASGHPRLNDGRIFTSDLIVLAPDKAWARTRSRFYVLAEPAAPSSSREESAHD